MSFPRYEKYKDSGVEWLGEVPEGWEVKRLKFLCDVQTGDKDTVNAVEDGEYPFFVRSQTVERINSHTFDCEAVLTAGDGVGVGKVFHYYEGKFDFHQRVYMMNNFRFVSGKFFFSYLAAMFHKVALEGGAKSTVDSLRMPLFLNFEVTIPTPLEQQTIAAFLDRETGKIDALVAEQERLIELLKEKRQAVISHAVTKGLNPDAPMKDSGIEWLGEVPEGWEVVALKRIASIRYGIGEPPNYKLEGTPLIRATNVFAGRISQEGMVFVDPKDIPEKRIIWLNAGDIIVVRSGAYTGDSAIIKNEHCPCIAGFDMVVTPQGCHPYFLQYALLSTYLKNDQIDLERLRAAQPHLNSEELGACLVVLAPTEVQSKIVAFLDSETAKIDALITEAQQAIGLLKERRSALISATVTGKIDVRGNA